MRRTTLRCLVLVLLSIAACMAIAGCGGHKHRAKVRSKPTPAQLEAPPLPQNHCKAGSNHSMGDCLPRPVGAFRNVSIPAGIRCIDLSNNDPVFGVSRWRAIRAAGIVCAYFKVNESTTFVDRTAAAMARDARAAGLIVGGYDFQHVCISNPTAEADVFVDNLHHDGLVGPGTLRPSADTEYGSTSCNGPAWESAWRARVRQRLAVAAFTYTGEWWWGPHFGGYWPSDSEDWISGYGVSWPFMPSGRRHLDMWQYTDHGWNGVSTADEEVWLNGSAAFRSYLVIGKPAPPKKVHCLAAKFPHRTECYLVRYGYDRTKRDLVKVNSRLKHYRCSKPVGICGGYFWAQGRDILILRDFRRKFA